MKKILITLAVSGLICTVGAGTALADSHVEGELKPPSPVELWACSYNEGKGPADLDKAIAGWNAWADKNQMNDYFGWTLVPYYFSSEQDFDVLWLGDTDAGLCLRLGSEREAWVNRQRGRVDERHDDQAHQVLVDSGPLTVDGPVTFEFELYATPFKAFRLITLPLLWPGIIAGLMLAFVISLDDVVITEFVKAPGQDTLPTYMLGQLRRVITPEVHAISTALLSISVLLVSMIFLLNRKKS